MERVRELVHADAAHKMGYIGSGITVAVMDTGIVGHPDFSHRIVDFLDFTSKKKGMYDDNGHGTHVSGIIGGSGFLSHGRYVGMAPGCSLIMLKVLDRLGNGNTSQVLSALKWIINYRDTKYFCGNAKFSKKRREKQIDCGGRGSLGQRNRSDCCGWEQRSRKWEHYDSRHVPFGNYRGKQ